MNYLEREYKEWDGIIPVYCEKYDKYFFSSDEIEEYLGMLEDDGEEVPELSLLICRPNYMRMVDEDYWCDFMPEEIDELSQVTSKEFIEALTNLNQIIKNHKPVSWSPSQFRTEFFTQYSKSIKSINT